LADLERLLPDLADRLKGALDNATRVKVRRVQTILANVRWNYGPPGAVERIPAGDDAAEGV
jgi:hypothetical protein